MTCAVDFIVERVENVLLVQNAALRFQPASLSAEQISDMVFVASLANMTEEQQQAALEARAAREQGSDAARQNQNNNTSITSLMMGQQRNIRAMPVNRQTATRGQGGSPAVVLRNLWFINGDGRLDVMQVRIGISDTSVTEVFLDDDFEDLQVILRERI